VEKPHITKTKKARQVKSNVKSMIITCFDVKGIVHEEFVATSHTLARIKPGCFAMTTPRLTIPSSPSILWRKTKLLLSPTQRTSLIWDPVTSSYFQK
jgi:hypothetical protein